MNNKRLLDGSVDRVVEVANIKVEIIQITKISLEGGRAWTRGTMPLGKIRIRNMLADI